MLSLNWNACIATSSTETQSSMRCWNLVESNHQSFLLSIVFHMSVCDRHCDEECDEQCKKCDNDFHTTNYKHCDAGDVLPLPRIILLFVCVMRCDAITVDRFMVNRFWIKVWAWVVFKLSIKIPFMLRAEAKLRHKWWDLKTWYCFK